jgi:hypothetical protein
MSASKPKLRGAATLCRVAAVLAVSLTSAASAQPSARDGAHPASSRPAGRGETLPPWSEGELDIHHISTGRGNSAFVVMPDGTTLLIDAGQTDEGFIRSVAPLVPFPARPDASHDAGYWIADYVRQFAPRGRPVALDYALITHFHTDHMGMLLPSSPLSATGAYRLTGITEVGDLIPIHTLIDRAAPDYDKPVDLRACHETSNEKTLANYLKMVDYRRGHGLPVVGLRAGALDQIRLKDAGGFPTFHIRNIASSGVIWTGHGEETQQYIPADAIRDCHYDENPFSNVLKMTYGAFSYYSGGDIPGVPSYDQPWWRNVETPVAAVVGRVSAMTLDHHGNRDTVNGDILRALQPRVIVQQNWLSAQPGEEVVWRLASKEYYPGPRDVFSTGMADETRAAIGPLMDKVYRSYNGHVLIRVAPGGSSYQVFILNDENDRREVIAHFGPYSAL